MLRILFFIIYFMVGIVGSVAQVPTSPSASILPNAMTQFTDQNGAPYASGTVYFYVPYTTTPKNTWQDPNQQTLNQNPVILDANGRALIYGSGQYREILKDQFGNTIWDQLTYGLGNINLVQQGTNVLSTGALCDGSTNDSGAFVSADQTSTGSIFVPYTGHPCVIGSNITLTHPVQFAPGAEVSVSSGITLALSSSPIVASQQQIFTGVGTVTLYLNHNQPVYAEWWGCVANGIVDCTAAINSAGASISGTSGGNIELLSGVYLVNCSSGNAVTLGGGQAVGIYGQGMNISFVEPSTNCTNDVLAVAPTGQSGDFHDFTIKSTYTPATFIAIDCQRCGTSHISNMQFFKIGTAIWCELCEDMKFDWLYVESCGLDCEIFGGSSLDETGGQHVGIITVNHDFVSSNAVSTNNCIRFDSGSNSMMFENSVVGGCTVDYDFQNTYSSTGAHRPEDIRFVDMEGDSAATVVFIHSAWGIRILRPDFGSTTASSVILDSGTTGMGDQVDGVFIEGGTIRGAAADGVRMINACNLEIKASKIYENGTSTPGSTYAAVHALSGSCGQLVLLANNLAGGLSADETNTQAYSVVLDSGSLATINTCGPGRGATCVGLVSILGNNTQGNDGGGTIVNNGAVPTGNNIMISNNQGYNSGYTVANLPNSAPNGTQTWVTDQTSSCPAKGSTFTGSGSTICPAFYNGTNWVSP